MKKPRESAMMFGVLLVAIFLALELSTAHEFVVPEDHMAEHENESFVMEMDRKNQMEYREKFCRIQYEVRHFHFEVRECEEINPNHLKFFLSLFVIMAMGAVVRTVIKIYDLNFPYTVILMLIGIVLGFGTRINDDICLSWSMYTIISRMNPTVILNIFLPALIFESAFSMNVHTFTKSAVSILILAFPGMIVSTLMTALFCQQFFHEYEWNFLQACLFGSIISATDPVAVVSILKSLGAPESLSIMIEGESLFNDGVAILLYEIFGELVEAQETGESPDNLGLHIFVQFIRITCGGPLFGWFMGKLSILFLSSVFNDEAVEASITLVAAYLTYYIGEAFLGVSGVMAVVIMGIIFSAEKTAISPEVQGLVHNFWEMIGYLANTVLFVMVGVVISEAAINSITATDIYYLIVLYFSLNIARFLMVAMMSPILSRVGYGNSWQNTVVMTWGGLRGAVGICLSLEVYKNKELCENISIGPKFLIQTAGIVLLTLTVNATTTKALLDILKLTQISIGKRQDMANAVKQIQSQQMRALTSLQHDRFLADANWDLVTEYTSIEDPYKVSKRKTEERTFNFKLTDIPSILPEQAINQEGVTVCPKCDQSIKVDPGPEEYREKVEEARLRLLKALKVSCWRQFESGTLTEEAVQALVNILETVEDKRYTMVHASDFAKFWEVRGISAKIKEKLEPHFAPDEDDGSVPPSNKCLYGCYYISGKDWFDGVIYLLIILNMVPVVWETMLIVDSSHIFTKGETWMFLVTNTVFVFIFIVEFLIKVMGRGITVYCSSKWNIIDFIVLVVNIAEAVLSFYYLKESNKKGDEHDMSSAATITNLLKFLRFARLVRIARIFRLLRPIGPKIMDFLDGKVNTLLFLGYDVGKGFLTAAEDVIKFLPQMVDQDAVLIKLTETMDKQRLEVLRQIGILQKNHPGIAIAVKTRHGCRSVLNKMRRSLSLLKEEGLVGEREYATLLRVVEEKMQHLLDGPKSMPPPTPRSVMKNIPYFVGNQDLLNYIFGNATLVNFAVGDSLCNIGEPPNGIYIIISGLVKVHYEPGFKVIQAAQKEGRLPNMEVFPNLILDKDTLYETPIDDYLSIGEGIGELGVLTDEKRSASAICETGVLAYHIPQSAMKKALQTFNDPYDSLEERIWRFCAMRIAASFLPMLPAFSSWTIDKVKSYLEHSAVPIGEKYLSINITSDFIAYVVLIYGQMVNHSNEEEVFSAPCLIPPTVTRINQKPGANVIPRVLVISKPEDEESEVNETVSNTSFKQHILASSSREIMAQESDIIPARQRRQSLAINFGVRANVESEGAQTEEIGDASSSTPRGLPVSSHSFLGKAKKKPPPKDE